ncbi:hypothetical protein [Umezakia ovalisporum]|jgi:hypothetical protein|uniref:Uncharacterized protein n=2 Tax=Umezakia ovalisporum TaxID=75695 RepID=A0AA43GXM9_9CYAN|nr:hypothetical protein [Umezakia ovalisporum]MBI1241670.1 hypothetical protein [Nostoc sp. RI_552]MDH6055854.1 hypothetical protein [Umezakia ovalisporum FSS-43]MDH6063200.1 hypothetical protein [Umezakia ovalisporum FSS-62]MDH6068912.1 hypothetical protein [Umezakia ovalisporum APH033B]MDH6070662.1 hypothetical protein [Umezakia ovalisporum CobakiLakeA]
MANIILSQLHHAGSELFHDSEGFLHQLSDVDPISGGQATVATATTNALSNLAILFQILDAYTLVDAMDQVTLLAKSFSINIY